MHVFIIENQTIFKLMPIRVKVLKIRYYNLIKQKKLFFSWHIFYEKQIVKPACILDESYEKHLSFHIQNN